MKNLIVFLAFSGMALSGFASDPSKADPKWFKVHTMKKCTTSVPGVMTRDDTHPDDPSKNGCLPPLTNTCFQVITECPDEVASCLNTLVVSQTLDCDYLDGSGNWNHQVLTITSITNLGSSGYSANSLHIDTGVYILIIKDDETGNYYEIHGTV